jgi:hypothetical protein
MSVAGVTLSGMKREVPRALIRLQEGVFSRAQALEAGITAEMIAGRVRSGTWRRVCRGVYTDTAAHVSRPGMRWAALLCVGRFAVLSHETAAEVLALGGRPDHDIHVTVPEKCKVEAPPWIRIHRSRRAFRLALVGWDPPCTSVEETVLDMVDAAGTFDDMCGWITRALARQRTTAVRLRDAMSKRRRLRWRLVLSDMINATITGDHSVLEHRYEYAVERAHGLPEPDRQVSFTKPDGTRGFRDRAYPGYRVVVELDGRLSHPPEGAWDDKERDNAAIESGHEPLRYGWKHVTQHACTTAIQVAKVLRANGWAGQPHPCSARCPVRMELPVA